MSKFIVLLTSKDKNVSQLETVEAADESSAKVIALSAWHYKLTIQNVEIVDPLVDVVARALCTSAGQTWCKEECFNIWWENSATAIVAAIRDYQEKPE